MAHILVSQDTVASEIIRRLDAGESFAGVAREKSADESGGDGGDLGWINLRKLPKEFADVVQTLKVGEYTPRPVKTQYGWHVIRLLETRSAGAPPLQAVRAQITANLQEARYQEHLAQMLAAEK